MTQRTHDAINAICKKYNIALCYLFGSQAGTGKALLAGESRNPTDPEADIDFAVLFKTRPEDALTAHARISLDLQSLVMPFRADLLFLHEVDHLIQLEAIRGICIYALDETFREEYEERVMMFSADEIEIFRRNEQDLFEAIDHGYFEFEYKADRG
jgi:predicted nucleotidyltransferase